jgi:hypothetical protein
MAMVDLSELKHVVHRIAQLLDSVGERDFGASFADLNKHTPPLVDQADVGDIARSIRRYFGTAGSFNDLILHEGGVPMVSENDELDRLRRRLFKIEGELRDRLP